MAARAIWKAVVRLGGDRAALRIPVRLYSAVEEGGVQFRLLHARDHAPVVQKMVEPTAGRPVPRESLLRGLELEEGTLVVLRAAELEALAPPPSRDVKVEQVVDRDSLDLRWFDRPYYLGPDGDEPAYFALAQVLELRRQVAIARWVMRRKRYQGALYSRGGYLLLSTLRHAEELVALEELRPRAARELDQRELALAGQLVAALEDHFDPSLYRDQYRDRVRELIEAKSRGQAIKLGPPRARRRVGSLAESLEASLRMAREGNRG